MITKQEIETYEEVRKSGLTNMFDVNKVIELGFQLNGQKLTREQVFEIMKNYDKYLELLK